MLTEIMAATDRKAALCGLEDRELDRVCAGLQDWQWCEDPVQKLEWYYRPESEDSIFLEDYTPSRDLNQAYELAATIDERRKLNCFWSYANQCYEFRVHWIRFSDLDFGPDLFLRESDAKSHSRAVAILACLALMEGME